MDYIVKTPENKLTRLHVISGAPQVPEGFEIIGLENEINPNNIPLEFGKIRMTTIQDEQQVLVSPEVLAAPAVDYQAEVLAQDAIPEKWIKDGEADLFVDPKDDTWTHVPAVPAVAYQPEIQAIPAIEYKAAVYEILPAIIAPRVINDNVAKNEADKAIAIKTLYDAMVKDVYDQMEVVFGTRNDVSASATASTWEAMKARPENYSQLGLADVVAYADLKLAEADAYAIFRLKRIAQYQADKAKL